MDSQDLNSQNSGSEITGPWADFKGGRRLWLGGGAALGVGALKLQPPAQAMFFNVSLLAWQAQGVGRGATGKSSNRG